MAFSAECSNLKARQFEAHPTLADGVTPAKVDPNHPYRIVATDGSPVSSARDPEDPTNILKCVAFVPDGFVATSNVKGVLDADMDPDQGEGTAQYREIAEPGVISWHDPEAEFVGTTVGGEVDKPTEQMAA